MKKPPSRTAWQYGVSPNPKNWQEAADALKTMRKPKGNPVMDRLDTLEQLLKDKK